MNITTQARLFVMLMLTATVAIATASASPDQAVAVQIDPSSIHPVIHSDTYSIQAPQQRLALLAVPAAKQSQVDNWNTSQSALPTEPVTPVIKDSTHYEDAIVLPVITLHSRPTMIQRIGYSVSSIVP
jgi:hypothetical protein